MPKKTTFSSLKWLLTGGTVAVLLTLPRVLMQQRYAPHLYNPQEAPTAPFAVVLGAGLRRDGRPTRVLADRVRTAAALYQQGKVEYVIMSGSLHYPAYDEPRSMRDLAMELGVPSEVILLDRGGSRTYQTCLRAKEIYGVDNALIVSQRFHLPRALALCDAVGIQAAGVSADLSRYYVQLTWELREIPATYRALWDAFLYRRSQARTPRITAYG
jgi:vancomycin permeability regulator SanA